MKKVTFLRVSQNAILKQIKQMSPALLGFFWLYQGIVSLHKQLLHGTINEKIVKNSGFS